MSASTYLVFVIQGYEAIEPETPMRGERLTDFVTFEIIAKTANEALDKAKQIMPKNNYRVSGVIEKYADQ